MSHWVTLKPSDHKFEVAEGQTVLQAGLEAGFALPFSCRQGVCRTCRGSVLEGAFDFGDVHPAYLSEADRARGQAHLCQAKPLSDMVIEVRELEGLAGVKVSKVPCRVAKIERPAPDVTILHLRLPMNENMMFVAGQHVELLLAGDRRRTYSIASKPSIEGVTALELHIRHIPGGFFTDDLLGKIKERELMKFEGPLGSFFLRTDSEKPIVMVAGDTGFSPIKSMCEAAFERNIDERRPITLYWGGRTRRDLYRIELPVAWAQARPNFKFVPVLSEPTPDCNWSGRTGFAHAAAMSDLSDMSAVQVYACGAPLMIEAARRDFIETCGLPADEFFAETFLTEADRLSQADHAKA